MQESSEKRQSQKQDNMVQLTTKQRVFVVTNCIRMQNVREVQDAFRLRFPDRNPPLRNTCNLGQREEISKHGNEP